LQQQRLRLIVGVMRERNAIDVVLRERRVAGIARRSLETLAPVGGVLVGSATYEQLPPGTVAEKRTALHMKGKNAAVDAYVLHAVPC